MDTTEKQIREMFCNSGPFDRDEIALLMLQLVERIQNLEQAPQRQPLTDGQLRNLWAEYAAKENGWPNDARPPVIDIGNGPRFQQSWHESEYRIFKAGFEAANGIKGEA